MSIEEDMSMVSTFPHYTLFVAAALVVVAMLVGSHGETPALFVGP
jgi:hypothetical protein